MKHDYHFGVSALKFCLHNLEQVSDSQGCAEDVYGPESFAQQLIKAGSSPDAIEPESGEEWHCFVAAS